MAIDLIGDVAGGEYARHAGRGRTAIETGADRDVAVLHLELTLEDRRVRRMTDRDEGAGDRDLARRVVGRAAQAQAVHAAVVAKHFVDGMVPHDFDLAGALLLEQLVLHDLLGTQLVAAVHEGDLAADVGEIQRFLDCGVAAADDRDVLLAEEEAVAGRAGRYALALEVLLGTDAQILRGRSGRDDQRVAGVFAAVALEAERTLRQVGAVDVVEHHLGVEAFRVLGHASHQVRPLQALDVAGPIVDIGGRHQLSTLGKAGDEGGLHVGACSVHGSGVAGRARTEDDQSRVLGSAHV